MMEAIDICGTAAACGFLIFVAAVAVVGAIALAAVAREMRR